MRSSRAEADDGSKLEAVRPWRNCVRPLGIASGFLVAVIIAVVIWCSGIATRSPESAFATELSDSFDRPASTNGLGSTGEHAWSADAGQWRIEAGAALLQQAADGDSIASIDVQSANHTVKVRVAGLDQCGVVARYQDPQNFLALYRVGPYAVWNLVEVINGEEHLLSSVPDPGHHDLDVSLTATDHVVAAAVGFMTVTLVHETVPQGTRVGILARGDQAKECSWDDLLADRAR